MDHSIEILHTGFVTHDTKRFITSRPEGFEFEPGQGVEMIIDREGWRGEGRPFTPTSRPGDRVLEFTIKRYEEHDGVTDRLHELQAGDELEISDAFGAITYQGPGTFLAGGAGITPFLAILRSLDDREALGACDLIFSNRQARDVICEKELRALLGERLRLQLTRQEMPGYGSGRIDLELLENALDDLDRRFYLCGPPAFVDQVGEAVEELGADPEDVVVEK